MINSDFKREKRLSSNALIFIAILFFANPTIRLFDIFPDFIACIIVARALRFPADRAPFFAEARSAFIKLAIISLAKIPAFVAMISIRSTNVTDYDITALMTFSFAVIEALYFTGAINNLFAAFFYLGGRSPEGVLLAPFKTSPNEYSKKTMKPEVLKILTLVFTYVKLACGSLPEMLLLSTTTDYGSNAGFSGAGLFYPYVTVLCIAITIALGVVFAKSFNSYIRAIRANGSFYPTIDSLIHDEARIELDKKIEKRNLRQALDIFVVAMIFIFSLRLDNLRQINLVPLYVFAPLAIYALARLFGKFKPLIPTVVTGSLFFGSAACYQMIEFIFLDKYSFDLMATDFNARMAYLPTLISLFVTVFFFAALMICLGKALIYFSGGKVLRPHEVGSDRIRLDRFKAIRGRTIVWCVIAIFAMLTVFIDALLRFFQENVIVQGVVGYITTAIIPWFSTFMFGVLLVCFGFTIYLISSIKDDIDTYLK